MNKEDIEIGELLLQYKWDDHYSCSKCRNAKYKKSKIPLARVCNDKRCGYTETILKFTAFEGMRIPLSKAYKILEYIIDNCIFREEDQMIPWEIKLQKFKDADISIEDNYNEGKLITVRQLIDKYAKSEIDRARVENLLEDYMQSIKINLADLSRIFEVEENTVNKLLQKIDKRIRIIDETESDAISNIVHFLEDPKHDMNYMLGLLMFPMDERWVKNEIKLDNKWYNVQPPGHFDDSLKWPVKEINYGRVVDGRIHFFYNKDNEPDYPVVSE